MALAKCERAKLAARRPGWAAGWLPMLLASCAVTPLEQGVHDAATIAAVRGVPATDAVEQSGSAALAAEPLTAAAAVRLALANNLQLRRDIERLGFALAEVQDGRRVRNPLLAATRLNNPDGHDEASFGVMAVLADLLTLAARSRAANANYAAAKQALAAAMMNAAANAEAAYYGYVAARQAAALRAQIAKAAAVSAELAERFAEAGNLTPRALARERAAASEARLEALEAENRARRRRTELALAMGLSSGDAWQVPARLPAPLPQAPGEGLQDLLQLALAKRLDLAVARATADVAAKRLGIERWRQWLGDVEIGVESERHDGGKLRGTSAQWRLPLPPSRGASTRRRTQLRLAVLEVARSRQLVDGEVRTAHAAMRSAAQRTAEFRERLMPARREATEHTEAERNYMLVGVFEVLAEKQREYAAYHGYLAAVRDYHLARSDLRRAVGAALPRDAEMGGELIDVAAFVRPASHGASHGAPEPRATE